MVLAIVSVTATTATSGATVVPTGSIHPEGAHPPLEGVASGPLRVTLGVSSQVPIVTLDPLPARSNDASPSFAGTASDTTLVSIDVYKGESAAGKPLATLKAQGTGGSWVSGDVSPPLPDGTYTALASQTNSPGATGMSAAVTFAVDTHPPAVTLSAPPARSRDVSPSFSGAASDATTVTVEIFEGPRPEPPIVASVTAQGTKGGWSSDKLAPALPSGRHTFTAIAIQPSEINNAAGKSAPVTFVVDTEPPTVTLTAPPSPSKNTTPSFAGRASDPTTVTVEVFAGTKPEGKPLATATASPSGGSWTSGAVAPALASGSYTAIATQPSAIGNGPGASPPATFVIDTAPPTLTLNAPASPSGNRSPTFSGTASDHTPVVVDIYKGAAVVASATAEVLGGEWVSDMASPQLEWGQYTAVATQASSIGNPVGMSPPMTFLVQPIAPEVATEGAVAVTRSSAALYASVNPRDARVSNCYFQYGTTVGYGRNIECGYVSPPRSLPLSGTAAVPVFARVYGLAPATTYHFRIVADGEGGSGAGADRTFTTGPPWVFNEEGSPATAAAAGGSAKMSTARVAALLAQELKRAVRGTRIGGLLRSGAFKALLSVPEAGSARIAWYEPGVKRRGKTVRARVLIAYGAVTFRALKKTVATLALTGAGRGALRASKRIELTATCSFTPRGAASARAFVTFAVSR
jgi:hypothetical protein